VFLHVLLIFFAPLCHSGNKKITTRERHKRNTRDPRFFEVFEFSSKLPGINDIKISVKDHNEVFTDELIGATVIDIEDR